MCSLPFSSFLHFYILSFSLLYYCILRVFLITLMISSSFDVAFFYIITRLFFYYSSCLEIFIPVVLSNNLLQLPLLMYQILKYLEDKTINSEHLIPYLVCLNSLNLVSTMIYIDMRLFLTKNLLLFLPFNDSIFLMKVY